MTSTTAILLTPAMASSNIDQAFIDQAKQQLWQAINDDDLISDWFARFMTATKYPELEEMTEEERQPPFEGVAILTVILWMNLLGRVRPH